MSTRGTVHFCDNNDKTRAIVYRHSDCYPEGLGEDLKTFLKEVKDNVQDTRFDDSNYLAAKFIVWQAARFAKGHPLNFLSLGIMLEDPADIEYRYKVICNGSNNKLPEIITEKV